MNVAHSGAVDSMRLTGLRVFAHHGVFDFERENGQEFIIDIEIMLDLAVAAHSDDVLDTIHYGELAESIAAAVAADPVNLIEKVAQRVADLVLAYPLAASTTVTIHKPSAPISIPFADVSVSVSRTRQ